VNHYLQAIGNLLIHRPRGRLLPAGKKDRWRNLKAVFRGAFRCREGHLAQPPISPVRFSEHLLKGF